MKKGVTYYNHGGETWEEVCGIECPQNQSKSGFDYDYVFSHKGSIKPFAARHKTNFRWYKVKDDLPDPVNDHLGRPTYVLTNNNIDKNTYIRFYYVDEKENYKEITEPDHPFVFVCNTMQSKNLQNKLLYYIETYCRAPSCNIQGGKKNISHTISANNVVRNAANKNRSADSESK